ncbi:MAG: glycosyltransferase family 2 protein [Salibacteraceae bacterium]|nr:glycosyltransferase family 2 protein [Salibacteraceae bacterium]|tara:strand:+ start:41412 stop:42302 length:891 start_codon:yes stop_codon:yes gene_type:complete
MISILIPIYNVDITDLVTDLCNQAKQLIDEKFEILCLDDCSTNSTIKQLNTLISKLDLVKYSELNENVGRGNIRMLLAKKAKHETLIFLDCDMKIVSSNYLQKFVEHKAKKVVIGGITYSNNRPENPDFLLRWKYGIQREKKSASERNRMRFSHFVASNLLINKKIFLSLPVDNDIVGYGHEDTLLGLKLLKMGTPLSHIDNPLEHLGLDTAVTFIEKSKSGTSNLATLFSKRICGPEIRLISVYESLHAMGLSIFAFHIIKPFISLIEKNLKGRNPNIRLFDIWKLFYFMKMYKY